MKCCECKAKAKYYGLFGDINTITTSSEYKYFCKKCFNEQIPKNYILYYSQKID